MPIKQSFCLPCFTHPDLPNPKLFAAARDIGFAAVEFWSRFNLPDPLATIAQAHDAGLVVASMAGHNSIADGLNRPDQHARIEAELRAAIDLAAQQKIPGIICFSGNRNPGQSDLEALGVCATLLRKIAPYAEDKGVNLNLELLNSRLNHPNYQADHTAWGVALCEMVASPRVKLLYDIYHMQIMEGDIIATLTKHIAHIGHFHTAGVPGRHDLDNSQELNYPAICQAIARTGYSLYLGHEFHPLADPLTSLRHAFTLCNA